jgi:glucosylceramidase
MDVLNHTPPMRSVTTTPDAPWRENLVSLGTPRSDGGTLSPLRVSGPSGPPLLGFGGCFNELGARALFSLPETARHTVLDALFGASGCAFNFCRLPIGASDYALSWYSLADTPEDYALEHFSLARDRELLLPYVHAARALRPDLRLFVSPWSPPEWMKQPRRYNGGRLRPESRVHAAYAEYLLRAVLAYQAEGLDIAQLHVQNEPNSDQKFPSCLWTGAEMRDFIRDHLGPLFDAAGHPCEIWAGTLERGALQGWLPDQLESDSYHNWLHTILSDPAARAYIKGAGYQWAGKGALPQTRAEWPDLPLIQTEGECGDGRNAWSYAFYTFDLVWWYLHHGASAYIYWNMILPPGGESTWGWKQNTLVTIDAPTATITYNPEFYVMKHLAHFVRPGARALPLAGARAGFSLAFANPDGSRVLALANPAPHPVCFDLAIPDFTGPLTLPPRSITTLMR